MSEPPTPLAAGILSSTHRHYAECGSTNDAARAWALDNDNPAPHGALVTSDFQTRGRGRRGRGWDSSAGQNVIMSVIARTQIALADAWQIGFAAGIAVADALEKMDASAQLKWPNDVLVDGKKLAGILVEIALLTDGQWVAIIGIGVNINQVHFEMVQRMLYPATSLALAAGKRRNVPDAVRLIEVALGIRISELERAGWETTRAAWRAKMADRLTVTRGSETGICVDLDPDGSARVQSPDGTFARWASVETSDEPQNGLDSV